MYDDYGTDGYLYFQVDDFFDDGTNVNDLVYFVTDVGGNIVAPPEEIVIDSLKFSESLCSDNVIRIGSCESSEIELKVMADGHFKSTAGLYRLRVATRENYNSYDSSNPNAGNMIVTAFELDSNTLDYDRKFRTITGYGIMTKLASLDCTDWYNNLDFDTYNTVEKFRNALFDLYIKPYGGYGEIKQVVDTGSTLRDSTMMIEYHKKEKVYLGDLLEDICALNGCFGRIDRNWDFHYTFLQPKFSSIALSEEWKRGLNVTTSQYYDSAQEEKSISPPNSITVVSGDYKGTRTEKDDDESERAYTVNLKVLDLISDTECSNAGLHILENISGSLFIPIRAKICGNPCIDVGDYLVFQDRFSDLTLYSSYIFERTFTGAKFPKDEINCLDKTWYGDENDYARSSSSSGGSSGGGGGGSYTLPVATDAILGGVMVGANLTITEDGVLSAEPGSEIFTSENTYAITVENEESRIVSTEYLAKIASNAAIIVSVQFSVSDEANVFFKLYDGKTEISDSTRCGRFSKGTHTQTLAYSIYSKQNATVKPRLYAWCEKCENEEISSLEKSVKSIYTNLRTAWCMINDASDVFPYDKSQWKADGINLVTTDWIMLSRNTAYQVKISDGYRISCATYDSSFKLFGGTEELKSDMNGDKFTTQEYVRFIKFWIGKKETIGVETEATTVDDLDNIVASCKPIYYESLSYNEGESSDTVSMSIANRNANMIVITQGATGEVPWDGSLEFEQSMHKVALTESMGVCGMTDSLSIETQEPTVSTITESIPKIAITDSMAIGQITDILAVNPVTTNRIVDTSCTDLTYNSKYVSLAEDKFSLNQTYNFTSVESVIDSGKLAVLSMDLSQFNSVESVVIE